MHRHAHLAAGAEHVDGVVVVGAEVGAVGGGRLGELVDFFAQRRDVLARFTQRVGELLVVADGLGQLALGLEQLLFEGTNALGRILEPTAERDDFLFERHDLFEGGG